MDFRSFETGIPARAALPPLAPRVSPVSTDANSTSHTLHAARVRACGAGRRPCRFGRARSSRRAPIASRAGRGGFGRRPRDGPADRPVGGDRPGILGGGPELRAGHQHPARPVAAGPRRLGGGRAGRLRDGVRPRLLSRPGGLRPGLVPGRHVQRRRARVGPSARLRPRGRPEQPDEPHHADQHRRRMSDLGHPRRHACPHHAAPERRQGPGQEDDAQGGQEEDRDVRRPPRPRRAAPSAPRR
jgi:hypothetical protein